ncbi:MAG: ABC transporter permease [Chroococcidiopsidaceae cyanobacterium CP_BM_RX_35]|nr:ABC transporter permease [Chroococcidiopsidaceae cyanobacterium CP_BM_RX_35]
MGIVDRLFSGRFWALALKELNQILRNKELVFLLIFPPTIQLVVFGLALNPEVQNITLGIVDQSNTPSSRELVSAFTENHVFKTERYNLSAPALGQEVEAGQVTVGLVIPPKFNSDLQQDDASAQVQVLINAVDANTAGIASGYITQIVSEFSDRFDEVNAAPGGSLRENVDSSQPPASIAPQIVYLYNPGLDSTWFFVPGVLGVVVLLNSSLVSSATVVREKELGTLEQLLMTPAAAWEILLAKVVPIWVMIVGDAILALGIGHLLFGVPIHSFGLFLVLSGSFVLVGIGIGVMLATYSRNQQQAQLTSFFVTLPVIQFSGAISPIESMPVVFRYLSLLNPLNHYIVILRGLLLKGVGLDVLWPNALALLFFATILMAVSINRFRAQQS